LTGCAAVAITVMPLLLLLLLLLQVRWAGDRCCVCDSDVDYDCDRLVSCDGCGITVHQSCYGIPDLPDEDDMWLCRCGAILNYGQAVD
jgi:hypothetical protein